MKETLVIIPPDNRTQILPERKFSIVWTCKGDLPQELTQRGELHWRSVPHEGMTTANGFIDARMPLGVLNDHNANCQAVSHSLSYDLNLIT